MRGVILLTNVIFFFFFFFPFLFLFVFYKCDLKNASKCYKILCYGLMNFVEFELRALCLQNKYSTC
jgi:hypothetical protein